MTVTIGPGRDKALNIKNFDSINERCAKNEKVLEEVYKDLGTYLAEAHGMMHGLDFVNGRNLAYYTMHVASFVVGYLMEQGYINKTVKGAKAEASEDSPKGYL